MKAFYILFFCSAVICCHAAMPKVTLLRTRNVFYRMEKDAFLEFKLENKTSAKSSRARLETNVAGRAVRTDIPALEPGKSQIIRCKLDLSARPGNYKLNVGIAPPEKNAPARKLFDYSIKVLPRKAPYMPVIMWGNRGKNIADYGFTHFLKWMVAPPMDAAWKAGKVVEWRYTKEGMAHMRAMNNISSSGLNVITILNIAWWANQFRREEVYNRLNRDGSKFGKLPDMNHPDFRKFAYNYSRGQALSFQDFKLWDAVLVNSEIRGRTSLSFSKYTLADARKALGFEIPSEITHHEGVPYGTINNFPVLRIIPDDNKILRFYSWFWEHGDGWNSIHSESVRGFKSASRNIWTFHDPAVRVPSKWGSGGNVDVISQWSYTAPDPLKAAVAGDELFAMAEGKKGQKVMNMTQLIWYRSQTAPAPQPDPAYKAAWEKKLTPKNKFITVAPDHLSEAFFLMLARPVSGIMFHGPDAIMDGIGGTYSFTNPETPRRLSALIRNVVKPLGPALLKIGNPVIETAFLESFSSQMFARRGSWGWGETWEADMHEILQWAGIQTKVIYDESIAKNGLGNIKVLFMPYCDVLTESTARAVREFQEKGGIVVADEYLAPGIIPDILVPYYKREKVPHKDKAELQKKAAVLRKQLHPYWKPRLGSSNADLITHLRSDGKNDFIFVINDKRTYGDYVGHHKMVMEKGLPNAGKVFFDRKGYVYDLAAHRLLRSDYKNGVLQIPVKLAPGGGMILMVSDSKIEKVSLSVSSGVKRDSKAEIKVLITDKKGKAVPGILPVKVDIIAPDGTKAEYSASYAAVDGQVSVFFTPAFNDPAGTWKIRARELAAGNSAEIEFNLK